MDRGGAHVNWPNLRIEFRLVPRFWKSILEIKTQRRERRPLLVAEEALSQSWEQTTNIAMAPFGWPSNLFHQTRGSVASKVENPGST